LRDSTRFVLDQNCVPRFTCQCHDLHLTGMAGRSPSRTQPWINR
jgi:hypothetical protein